MSLSIRNPIIGPYVDFSTDQLLEVTETSAVPKKASKSIVHCYPRIMYLSNVSIWAEKEARKLYWKSTCIWITSCCCFDKAGQKNYKFLTKEVEKLQSIASRFSVFADLVDTNYKNYFKSSSDNFKEKERLAFEIIFNPISDSKLRNSIASTFSNRVDASERRMDKEFNRIEEEPDQLKKEV